MLRRVVKSTGTQFFTYPFGLMDSTYNGSGVQQLENDYYTLAGRLIGERESGVTVFLLTDELGSVITSISAAAGSAAVTSNQVYSPYGSPRYRKGTAPTTKGFTGQYHDGSGLDYYNARYYDPVVGRFVSADIKQGNAQGMDPYSYVGNNPETRNDPTGQRRCDSAGECETSPGSGNGGGGNPPPSGCTWNGRPCTKTNNPCIGTVWNGSGCIPKPDHTQAKLDVRKNHLAPKIFYAITLLVSGGLILLVTTQVSYRLAKREETDESRAMTNEEELQALREENRVLKALVAELLPLKEQLAQANARIKDLEDRVAKDSRTSRKPPSSDGLGRLPRRSRRPSGKRPGGQAGHPGHTLSMVDQPDEVVRHHPTVCSQCNADLSTVPGRIAERRQVLDVPEIRLLAHEHHIEAVCCPTCHTTSLGSFPASVNAPVQYGPNLQALAVYLHQGQLLPTARTCEALAALCGCHISEASLIEWSDLAAERLEPTVARIAELIAASRLQHADETGIRVYGMLHWLHVNCTRFLTHLAWHPARGREAMDEIGIWPRFRGRGMHDRFASYDAYDCAHSICGAHLLRDCAAVAEQEQQEWAAQMQDVLLDVHDACQQWRLLPQPSVPNIERDDWAARYFEILAAGYAAQPPPPPSPAHKGKGRRKQSKAKNLLDALMARAEQVLALLNDLQIPFTNNQAERDLRWAKVQQKISGTFRSATGVTAFCRIRSYLSTMQKQGHPMLSALTAVFHGHPLPVAWGPE